MPELHNITDQKIQNDLTSVLDALKTNLEDIYKYQASIGKLRSGDTFKNAMQLINNFYKNLNTSILGHHKWAIGNYFFVTDRRLASIKDQATFYKEQFIKGMTPLLKRAAKMANKPILAESYYPEVVDSIERAHSQYLVEIDSFVLTNRNLRIKGMISSVPRFLISLFKGG